MTLTVPQKHEYYVDSKAYLLQWNQLAPKEAPIYIDILKFFLISWSCRSNSKILPIIRVGKTLTNNLFLCFIQFIANK